MSCAKINIPEDSCIGNSYFGGYCFSANLQFGGFKSPSTLTLQIINKNGEYSLPKLPQGDKFYTKLPKTKIALGGGKFFNGTLVGYSLQKKADQKILSVSFKDNSYSLDQLNCGLDFYWGSKTKNKQDDLILLGKQMNPCDQNGDSEVSFDEQNASAPVDYCSVLLACQAPDAYEDRCKSAGILPVRYTINELINKLSSYKIKVRNASTFNKLNTSPAEFTGLLRSVLSSWCQEYGLSFYWDYNTDELVFIDLSEDVKIDFNKYISLDNIDEYTQTESIEETYSQGVVSYYEREGELKDYQADGKAVINLRPLTYADLIDVSDFNQTEINLRELSIALSYYSSTLREVYQWFYYYGIKGPTQAEQYLYDNEAAQNSISAPGEDLKVLKNLANMKILQVASFDNDNAANFSIFEKSLAPEKLATLRSRSQVYSQTKSSYQPVYYFIIAEFDDQLLAKQYEEEANLAQNYLGRNWIRQYNPNLCCGASAISQVSVFSPDGTANFYPGFSNVNGLNFTSFGYEQGSYVDSLVQTANESESQQPETVESFGKDYQVNTSFVLAEREPKWYPNSSQLNDYEPTFDYYQSDYNFALVGENGRPNELLNVYPAAKNNPNIRLLLCNIGLFKGPLLPVTTTTILNFLEVKNPTKVFNTQYNNTSEGQQYQEVEAGQVGLTSRECTWITIDGFAFQTPVSAILLQGATSETSSSYKVLVQQSFTQQVEIPKIQSAFVTSVSNRGLRNEYLYKPIDSNDINIFAPQSCVPSEQILAQIHQTVTEYLGTEKVWPSKSVEFSMAGVIPYNVTIEEGLENFTITMGDNGVFTRYVISSRYAEQISDVAYQNIVKNIYQKLTKNLTVPPYRTKPVLTYPVI